MNFKRIEIKISELHKVVRYKSGDFEISASRSGIMFMGDSELIQSEEGLDEFARTVAKVWQEYLRMRRQENGISVE